MPRRFFYGWVVVAVSFVTLFLVVGTRFSLGVFYVAILEDYHWSRADTAGAFSLMLMVHAGFSLVVGALFDRLGPRKLFPLGAIAIAIGFAACSQIRAIWQFYVFLGVIASLGITTLAFVPHMALVSAWFVKRRGTASGLAYAGIGGGMLVLAPLLQKIISWTDWRTAFLLLSASMVLIVVPLTALLQRRRPEDLGLHPDGLAADDTDLAAVAARQAAVPQRDWTLQQALHTPQLWLLLATVAGLGMNLNTLVLHQMAHLTDLGYSKMIGATLTGLVGVMRSCGGMTLGPLSDRLGREQAYTLGSLLALLGIVLLSSIQNTEHPWRVYGFVMLYGLGYGALGPVYAAATADLFPGRHLGKILGVLEVGYGVGGALGTFVAGYLYDILGSYRPSFVLIMCAIVLSCLALWGAAPRRVRT